MIDLGQERSFDEVLLAWEVAGTVEDFHIDVSSDGNDYSTVYDAEAKADGYPLDTRVNFDSEVSRWSWGRHRAIIPTLQVSGQTMR